MFGSRVRRLLWAGVFVLVPIGVVASIARGMFVGDLATRMDPLRNEVLRAFAITDPHAAERPAEAVRFDSRFAAHPVLARLHVGLGAVFLVFAPLQFSAPIRNRYRALHRWSGRALLLAAFASTGAALFFGLLMPFGGAAEAAAIAFFGGLFLVSLTRAFLAIRRRDVARHREWMIRAFATAIGISTVRVVMMVLDPALTTAGFTAAAVFVVSIWTGWVLTVSVAELWIRYTRPRARPIAAAASAV